jgi:hypothetical protein
VSGIGFPERKVSGAVLLSATRQSFLAVLLPCLRSREPLKLLFLRWLRLSSMGSAV